MTNNIRVFLWLGLALAVWLNYSQWQVDYAPKPTSPVASNTAPDGSKPRSFGDTVPLAEQPTNPSPQSPSPAAAVPGAPAAAFGVVAVGGASAGELAG